MTNSELKAALLSQEPVILISKRHAMEIPYKCVSAIRYVVGSDGQIQVQAELLDYNDNSVTIARAEDVKSKEDDNANTKAKGKPHTD